MVRKDSPEIEINVHSTPAAAAQSSSQPPNQNNAPEEWFPWLVPTIFIINVALFILSMYINNCPAHSRSCVGIQSLHRFAFENIHENPLLGPSTSTLLQMGALDANKVFQGQRWRIFTCMWLHAGVFHIFTNMLSLLSVGIRLEQEFGFARIGLLYIVSGIGGSLLSSLFIRKTISVGASGALFGLLGAMLSELLTNWAIYANKVCSCLMVLILIQITRVYPFTKKRGM
ncbi:putative rhomboid protease [Helianthus anomalus]